MPTDMTNMENRDMHMDLLLDPDAFTKHACLTLLNSEVTNYLIT